MTDIDWTTYSDEELIEAQNEIFEEQTKRNALTTIPEQMADLNKQYLDASGVVEGAEWEQPTSSANAYPLDWIVTHNGGTWRSLIAGNSYEPGVAGWAVEDGGEWPMWVQPVGTVGMYAAGAKVSHVDKHWISDQDNNVWEPGVFGWTEEA